jgi:hypothetical protein
MRIPGARLVDAAAPRRQRSGRVTCGEAIPFVFTQATPDPDALVHAECIGQALGSHRTRRTDPFRLGLARVATFGSLVTERRIEPGVGRGTASGAVFPRRHGGR